MDKTIDLNKFIKLLFDGRKFDFRYFMDSLPPTQKGQIIDHVAASCDVSDRTVWNWQRAKRMPQKHILNFSKAVGFKACELFPEYK